MLTVAGLTDPLTATFRVVAFVLVRVTFPETAPWGAVPEMRAKTVPVAFPAVWVMETFDENEELFVETSKWVGA